MNRLQQEFSSRSKIFNRNSKEENKKNQNHSEKWKKKSTKVTSHCNDRLDDVNEKVGIKTMDHVENGLATKKEQAREKMPKNATNGKLFGKKSKPSKSSQQVKGKTSVAQQIDAGNEKLAEKPSKSPKTLHNIKEKTVCNTKTNAKKTDQESEVQDSKSSGQKKTIAKRKKRQNTIVAKKIKKEYSTSFESDSDAEDYIDKFFDDLPDDDLANSQPSSGSAEMDEISSDDNTSGTDSDSDTSENNVGNAMSLEELLNFFGNFRDKQANSCNSSSLKSSTGMQSKQKAKSEQMKNKPTSISTNQWIEEDNDVGLVYGDSDEEQASSCKALVQVANTLNETSVYVGFSPDESVDEEDLTSEDEMLSFEMEDDSELDDLSSSQEYSSYDDEYFPGESYSTEDYDSEEDESNFSEEEDDDDEFPSCWDDSYDSDDDGDYLPSEDEDDLFIGRGTARIYEIDDNNISFNSDIETAQIIELPSDVDRKRSVTTSATESQSEEEEKDADVESCPDLIPIYDDRGRLIENTEMFEKCDSTKVQSPRKVSGRNDTTDLLQLAEEPDRDNEPYQNIDGITDSLSQAESDPRLDMSKLSNYQFYDSIDMRMSLLVLKTTLYFSGHLTVQPLIGGLEIMGYSLKPGECKTAFAARGFHSLNLTPLPSHDGSRKKSMSDVLQRVEKHFLDADLKILNEKFDPSDSVLVLLQSDCNNRRVEVVNKYMPEETLFPKVEFLQRGVFFTSEYLLNAEFLTEHVDKCTRLYKSDPEWEKIHLEQSSRIIVIGGKGAGKSTLCQYLVNQAIGKFKKAVLIDLDIGQPIQHIPETISVTIVDKPLLGVACFNPIAPKKCWLFGSLDVVSSPIFYIQNIRKLIQYCHEHRAELSNIPWIINTMGYSTGFGDELMAAIIRMMAPSDVVQLVSAKKSLSIPNFQNAFTSDVVNQYSFNILRAEVQEFCRSKASFRHCQLNVCHPRLGFSLNAPKRRNLLILAHLAHILNDSSSQWFNEVRPFSAPLDRLQVVITREDQNLAEQQLPAVLNATLVYLCRKTDTGSLYECLGIGIVRGVDKNNNVFLLQSLPAEQLAEITVLAICSSSLPNAIFLRQSARIQGSIPYVYNIG